MMMRAVIVALAALLATGCGGAPAREVAGAPQPARKPPAPPVRTTLPASAFLGNYPPKWRAWTQKQWAALPLELRKAPPPSFRVLSGNDMKKLPGLGGQEAAGAFDTVNRVVYSRLDIFSYHERFLGHELGGHWAWYEGRDPRSKFAPLMTKEEITDWISFNDKNWRLIPQYSHLKPNQKVPHETFAVAANQAWYPGGKHPDYGRVNPAVGAKLRSYFGN